MATRDQDRHRRAQMRANGPVESFAMREIGERARWLCGICRDEDRPVDPTRKRPDPLSPSIDHIRPVASGGTHPRSNVQISHWFCNLEKNTGGFSSRSAEYMRAKLARVVDGTPIPEQVWRSQFTHWGPAARVHARAAHRTRRGVR